MATIVTAVPAGRRLAAGTEHVSCCPLIAQPAGAGATHTNASGRSSTTLTASAGLTSPSPTLVTVIVYGNGVCCPSVATNPASPFVNSRSGPTVNTDACDEAVTGTSESSWNSRTAARFTNVSSSAADTVTTFVCVVPGASSSTRVNSHVVDAPDARIVAMPSPSHSAKRFPKRSSTSVSSVTGSTVDRFVIVSV